MRIAPRHLVLLNGLTALACVVHIVVHATSIEIGEWHDYAVYLLVALSFLASLALGRRAQHEPQAA